MSTGSPGPHHHFPRLSCMSPCGGGVSVRCMAGIHHLSFCSHGQTAPSFQALQLVLAPGSSSSPQSLCNTPSRDPFCTLLPCFYVLFSKSLSLPPQHTPDPISPRTAASSVQSVSNVTPAIPCHHTCHHSRSCPLVPRLQKDASPQYEFSPVDLSPSPLPPTPA